MDFKTLVEKLHTNQQLRVAAHVSFWLLQFLLNWYLTSISFNVYSLFSTRIIALLSLTGVLNMALVYYPLVYYVLPKARKGKYMFVLSSTLILLITYTFINTICEEVILTSCNTCMSLLENSDKGYYQFLQTPWSNRMFAKLASLGIFFMLAFSICIPLAIKMGLQSFRQQLVAMHLAKENVELEFNFLKSQVNPHFLFNSLNNIYGLILTNENTKAAGTVARLSEFMRYSLYNSTSDKMPLTKELQVLKDYVELERIRLNFTTVTLNIMADRDDHQLPSLLLMPVIENAFKYSADVQGAYIYMQLEIKNSQLFFKAENSVDMDRQLQTTGGIGLQNLRKRLDLYYPGNHTYKQGIHETTYIVEITITL
ncbi:histidine kinase [Chitinophaga skermanii]|uniref:Histidine kinase n=1 Tax=Chitinophaga skermanii TaxID=331697 RepID=A0A327QX33_9BACT|nr:histidine kinase [Chitinophaga skermanii]RAJ08368.1 histidine kinase [Chitinophaga skermanii]